MKLPTPLAAFRLLLRITAPLCTCTIIHTRVMFEICLKIYYSDCACTVCQCMKYVSSELHHEFLSWRIEKVLYNSSSALLYH